MLSIGPISSLFDFLTFYIMLTVFSASEPMFQTGWFIESLATQTLVILIIRTAGNSLKNKPNTYLVLTIITVVSIGIFLPFSPLSCFLNFVPFPLPYFIFLGLSILIYLLFIQLVKQKLIWKWAY